MALKQRKALYWLALAVILLLSGSVAALLRLSVILYSDECLHDLLQLTNLPQAQACMRQNMLEPGKWLGWQLAVSCGIVGLCVGLALRGAHRNRRAGRQRDRKLRGREWEVSTLHLHIIWWLVLVDVILLFHNFMMYTNGLASLGG